MAHDFQNGFKLFKSFMLNKFPHWKKTERQERNVKQELYKILVKSKVSNVTELAKGIIRVIKGQS